jgi:hypothetical protein
VWLFSIQASDLQANRMTGVIEEYSNFRAVIRFLQAERVSQDFWQTFFKSKGGRPRTSP